MQNHKHLTSGTIMREGKLKAGIWCQILNGVERLSKVLGLVGVHEICHLFLTAMCLQSALIIFAPFPLLRFARGGEPDAWS